MKAGSPLRIYTPMASYILGEDYIGKLSLVGLFVDYNKRINTITKPNSILGKSGLNLSNSR